MAKEKDLVAGFLQASLAAEEARKLAAARRKRRIVAIRVPSGLKLAALTGPAWPRSTPRNGGSASPWYRIRSASYV